MRSNKNAPKGFTANEGQAQKSVLAVQVALQDVENKLISTEEAIKRIGAAKGFDEANSKLQTYAKSALETVSYMNAIEQKAAQSGVNINLQPLLDQIDEAQKTFDSLLAPHSRGVNNKAKKEVSDLLNEVKKGGDEAAAAQKN